jgi:pilus assembly protein CpaE
MIGRAGNVAALPSARAAAPAVQVFVRDRNAEGTIRQCLSNLGVRDAEFISGTIETAITTLAQKPSPRLLIVELDDNSDPAARVDELANVCEPDTGVIVIGDRNDIVLYRDLKRAGVAEYFFKPLVSDLVTRTCHSILTGTGEPQNARAGKLVFVLGVRGGVGATTVAVNSAWLLAQRRQRWVLLLDLDLQTGDAALQLDLTPSHALREAFEHPERVDKLFLERAVIHADQRIDVLASLEPLEESISYDDSAVLSLLETLLQRYRFIFIDVPWFGAMQLRQTLHLPSTCVLVSTGTLSCAREVARWREWLGDNTPERTTLHLLNQHGGPGCLPDQEFARAAGRAPDIVVPYDREIGNGSILGVKGMQKSAALKRGLAPLLGHLSGEHVEAPRPLLRRLFG